jgi:membrane protein implicated in regulation of membrane protease activity
MDAWQIWSIVAVALLIAEMFTGGFWLLCVAIGCAAAAIVGLVPIAGTITQIGMFAAASLASLVGLRPALVRRFLHGGPALRSGVHGLLGKTGYVSERIGGPTASGRIIVEGEDWRGTTLDGAELEPGTRVMVIQVDGTTLIVDKENSA